ncbi:MAG: sporulation initiation factor Spo0A C-terminal domain-containing protein [Christensenellaceae bacterium]|jgi:hypothetical protein|nr:sporulation initiation factor Spo0A C-terminal domain-containing protein [Christensenellaceae bacterium]
MERSDFVELKLLGVGATPEYTGYQYLVRAVLLAMEDPNAVNNMTTQLYPEIARAEHTTPANVERSVRTLIAAIWQEPDKTALASLLCRHYLEPVGNAKFIGMVSRRLSLEYKQVYESAAASS